MNHQRNRRRILSCLLVVAASCTGITARKEVILPALQRAWPDIRQDADAAIRHGFASGRLLSADAEKVERELRMANEAIRSGAGMGAVSWELVLGESGQGIDLAVATGDVSPAVAVELREGIFQFHEAVRAYMAR